MLNIKLDSGEPLPPFLREINPVSYWLVKKSGEAAHLYYGHVAEIALHLRDNENQVLHFKWRKKDNAVQRDTPYDKFMNYLRRELESSRAVAKQYKTELESLKKEKNVEFNEVFLALMKEVEQLGGDSDLLRSAYVVWNRTQDTMIEIPSDLL